jgi:hypothetical protein
MSMAIPECLANVNSYSCNIFLAECQWLFLFVLQMSRDFLDAFHDHILITHVFRMPIAAIILERLRFPIDT